MKAVLQQRGRQLLKDKGKEIVGNGAKQVFHEQVSSPVLQYVGDKAIDVAANKVIDVAANKMQTAWQKESEAERSSETQNKFVTPSQHHHRHDELSEADIRIVDELLEEASFVALKMLFNLIKLHFAGANFHQLILKHALKEFMAHRHQTLPASLIQQVTHVLDSFYTELAVRQKASYQRPVTPQQKSPSLPVSKNTLPKLSFGLLEEAATTQARWAVLEATYSGNIKGWMLGYELVKAKNWLDFNKYLVHLSAFPRSDFDLKNRWQKSYDGRQTLMASILKSKEKPPCYVQMTLLSCLPLNPDDIKTMALWPQSKENMFDWIDTRINDKQQQLDYWKNAVDLTHQVGRFFGARRPKFVFFSKHSKEVAVTDMILKIHDKITLLEQHFQSSTSTNQNADLSETQRASKQTYQSTLFPSDQHETNELRLQNQNEAEDALLQNKNEMAWPIDNLTYQLYFLAGTAVVLLLWAQWSSHEDNTINNLPAPSM